MISLLDFVFFAGPMGCDDAGDGNDDGQIDIADPIYLLNWSFFGGPAPPVPGPFSCGGDPTADALNCATYPACP